MIVQIFKLIVVAEAKILSCEGTFQSHFSWRESETISKWLLEGLKWVFKLRSKFSLILKERSQLRLIRTIFI